MSYKMLHDNVLIEPLTDDSGSGSESSAIMLPESAKKKPVTGKVLAVGPGDKEKHMTVKKGDVVLYRQWAGTEIEDSTKDSKKKLMVMKETDIFAVVEQ